MWDGVFGRWEGSWRRWRWPDKEPSREKKVSIEMLDGSCVQKGTLVTLDDSDSGIDKVFV